MFRSIEVGQRVGLPLHFAEDHRALEQRGHQAATDGVGPGGERDSRFIAGDCTIGLDKRGAVVAALGVGDAGQCLRERGLRARPERQQVGIGEAARHVAFEANESLGQHVRPLLPPPDPGERGGGFDLGVDGARQEAIAVAALRQLPEQAGGFRRRLMCREIVVGDDECVDRTGIECACQALGDAGVSGVGRM